MTLSEFIEALRNHTPQNPWYLTKNGALRTRVTHDPGRATAFQEGTCCPIEVLCPGGPRPREYRWCSRKLGLYSAYVVDITEAADNSIYMTPEQSQLRIQMLKAVGLNNPWNRFKSWYARRK